MTQDNANHDAVPAARAPADSHAPRGAVDRESVGTDKAEPLTRDCGTGNTDARLAALEELSALDQKLELKYGLTGNPMIKARPCKAAKKDTAQPRNGAPAEGSVQDEGSFRDLRNAKEPVAWALMRHGKAEQVAIHPVYLSGDIHRVAPLYAYQPPMLTAAERDAIQTAMNAYGSDNADPECAAIEATLWGLLERTK